MPTVDTVRTTWLLELMVSIKRPVVLVGETGTSKSATTANFLRGLDKDSTVRVCKLNFSKQTFEECERFGISICDILPSKNPVTNGKTRFRAKQTSRIMVATVVLWG